MLEDVAAIKSAHTASSARLYEEAKQFKLHFVFTMDLNVAHVNSESVSCHGKPVRLKLRVIKTSNSTKTARLAPCV